MRIPVQNGRRRPYGFVEFKHEVSVPYAARLFYQTCLYGRMLNLKHARQYGRAQTYEQMLMQQMPPPSPQIMTHLGPPTFENDCEPILTPPKIGHYHPYMAKKRTAIHMMPSTLNRKKTRDELMDKHALPDSLDFHGVIGNNEDVTKMRKEHQSKTEEDLRNKIKKKKKKKNKDGGKERRSKFSEGAPQDDKFTSRGGFDFHNPQKSFIRNAVNQLRNYGRNHRGSYDINNSRHKGNRHISFDT